MNRLSRIKIKLPKEYQGFLITNPVSIYYLTGLKTTSLQETESILLITPKQSYLIVPALYAEAAKKLVLDPSIKLIVDTEKKSLLTIGMNLLPEKPTLLIEENHLPTSVYFILKEKYQANPLPSKQLIEIMREIKSEEEIKLIQKSINITDQTIDQTIQWLQSIDYTTVTELAVADKIRTISTSLGGEGLGFDTIIASGKNTSQPHYIPQNKKLEKNAPLLIDMGILHKGYTGDLTRTIFLGKPPIEFRKYYTLVVNAQKYAVSLYQENIDTGNIQNKVVSYFTKQQVDSLFTHSIGHGIGLNIHENPHFSPKFSSVLKNNMIVTVEPGLYLENKFGIRIEDVVQIQGKKPKILSSSKYKNLFVIP